MAESCDILPELFDPLEHLAVLVVTEVVVGSHAVPRVEGVVADTVESLCRQPALVPHQNMVEVLVMPVRSGHSWLRTCPAWCCVCVRVVHWAYTYMCMSIRNLSHMTHCQLLPNQSVRITQ